MKIIARRQVAAAILVAALVAAAPAAAAPSPFRHDLGLVDSHLRIAIELAPAELGESLRTAEIVCNLGERATADDEVELAAADWLTLGQVIDQDAARQSRRIETAFRAADSLLGGLRERFERSWADAPTYLRELRRGVAATRRGIALMRPAVAGLATPFASWRAHECEAANRGVEQSFYRAPRGLQLINAGMLRLWRLALPGRAPQAGAPARNPVR